ICRKCLPPRLVGATTPRFHPRATQPREIQVVESITAAIRRVLDSPGFKFFLICGLILALIVPLLLVWSLIEEREQRARGVQNDVAREWGGPQAINGPVLVVPYTVKRVTMQGDKRVEELLERRAVFLPQ